MVGHGGSGVGSYLADSTSPIHSHCAVIILFKKCPSASTAVTSTFKSWKRWNIYVFDFPLWQWTLSFSPQSKHKFSQLVNITHVFIQYCRDEGIIWNCLSFNWARPALRSLISHLSLLNSMIQSILSFKSCLNCNFLSFNWARSALRPLIS